MTSTILFLLFDPTPWYFKRNQCARDVIYGLWQYLDWNGRIFGKNLVLVVLDKLSDGQHVVHPLDHVVVHGGEVLPFGTFTFDVSNGLESSETDCVISELNI